MNNNHIATINIPLDNKLNHISCYIIKEKCGRFLYPPHHPSPHELANLIGERGSHQENHHANHGNVHDGPHAIDDDVFQVAHGSFLVGYVFEYRNLKPLSSVFLYFNFPDHVGQNDHSIISTFSRGAKQMIAFSGQKSGGEIRILIGIRFHSAVNVMDDESVAHGMFLVCLSV